MTRSFRFPRSTIFLMVVIFAGVIIAIDRARDIQLGQAAGTIDIVDWLVFPQVFVLALALMGVAGAIGFAILFALRRDGVHRLSKAQTWPGQRIHPNL